MNVKQLLLAIALLTGCYACSREADTPPASSTVITAFTIDTANGIIDNAAHSIIVYMPLSTDVTKLSPVIVTASKATVSPASGVVQDFSKPVIYKVKAQDGTTQDYTVKVEKRSTAAILSFQVHLRDTVDYTGVFDSTDSHLIKLAMSEKKDPLITEVYPVIEVSPGATISPASEEKVDLSNPVTYTVTAANGEVQVYTVKVVNNQTWFSFNVPFHGSISLPDHPGYTANAKYDIFYAEDVAGLSGDFGVFEALETEDVSNITLDIAVPRGMTITPAPSVPQNFNQDVTYALKNEWGDTATFTVRCIKRKDIIFRLEIFTYSELWYPRRGEIRYWAETPVEKAWLIDEKDQTAYPLDITGTGIGKYAVTTNYIANVPYAGYRYRVQMPDGTIINGKTRVVHY